MTDTRTNEEKSAEVARRLFGKVECSICAEIPGKEHIVGMMGYASDHYAAFLVVSEMRKRGWIFQLEDDMESGTIIIMFSRAAFFGAYGRAQRPYGEEPRAICEAALAALDAEGETK